MKATYQLSVFGSIHPKEFMPRLTQYRFSFQKQGATWKKGDCILTVSPSDVSMKQAALKEGGQYLYRIQFEGEIHNLLSYLDTFFASMPYKITACRGFMSHNEFNRSKWISWLGKLKMKKTTVDGVFESKKESIGVLAHFTNELEVVARAKKGSYLKHSSLLAVEEVICEISPVREDLFSTYGMSV